MSVSILSQSHANMDAKIKYLLTVAPNINSMKDLEDNAPIEVLYWCEYTDTNKDGNTVELLSVMDKETHKVYATQSETFKDSFRSILEINGDDPLIIEKISGVTNAGRDFINCVMHVEF